MDKLERFKTFRKGGQPLVCLTAYTTPMAQSLSPHVDLLLVGDSMGTTIYGMDSTQGVTIEMMCAHGAAVMRAKPSVPVVVDMPYGSYERSDKIALENARRIITETGADAVKVEGGVAIAPCVKAIVEAGIPVLGHIGLLPQSAPDEGGYRIKGKTEEQIQNLISDAQSIESAGAFAIVIEGTMEDAASRVTSAVSIPTIGIGASASCDGQVLVSDDLFGLLYGHRPKFAPEYLSLRHSIEEAAERFAADVRGGRFPSAQYLYRKKA